MTTRRDVLDFVPPGAIPTAENFGEVIDAVRALHPTTLGGKLRRWRLLVAVRLWGIPTDEDIRDALARR